MPSPTLTRLKRSPLKAGDLFHYVECDEYIVITTSLGYKFCDYGNKLIPFYRDPISMINKKGSVGQNPPRGYGLKFLKNVLKATWEDT